MVFQPYSSYYVLTPDELSDMTDLLAQLELDYDLASNFELADDGNYYVIVTSSDIDEHELEFMDEWGFNNMFYYAKSTQSNSPV